MKHNLSLSKNSASKVAVAIDRSRAWVERKTGRNGQKIGWAGAERWADIPLQKTLERERSVERGREATERRL